ncbi:MAG: hypothetical protein GW760_09055 [Legionella sp.]|jgi:hypothetical protein|nr:hypothetical protein [Legionella sp.]
MFKSVMRGCVACGLALSVMGACAASFNSTLYKPGDKKDEKPENAKVYADECRRLALKLDWLGRYQDRTVCTQSLQGAEAYLAGHYIETGDDGEAYKLLEHTKVLVEYAIDLNCYGKGDMETVASDIEKIMEEIKLR